MCGYHEKFTLGAALSLPLSVEEHHKSLLMVSQTVRSVCHCPGGLLYHVTSEGHICSLKNKQQSLS